MSDHVEPRARRSRYWIAGIVIIAVLFAITAVGMWMVRSIGVPHEAAEEASYHDISELVIDSSASDIDIIAGDGDAVKVESTSHWRGGDKPVTSAQDSDGTLRLEQRGCGGVTLECRVDYRIEMPADTSVDIDQSAGNITTTGVAGAQRLDVSAGDMNFVESSGDITVKSDAGDITGERLESETVEVQQSAGDINLDFAREPASVKSTSDAGNIEIAVPGTDSYAVDADSSGGDVNVTAPEKDSADREITAHTAAGNVTVRDSQD